MNAQTTVVTIFLDAEMSGTPRRIARIAKYLDCARFRSVVILPKAKHGTGEFARILRSTGVTVYEIPELNRLRYSANPKHLLRWFWHLAPNIRAVREILVRERPRILHVYGTTQVTGPIAALGLPVKVLWHINDDALPVWLARLVFPAYRRMCDRFSASSTALAEHYFGGERQLWPPGLAVLYSTVDLPQFVPSESRAISRARLGVNDELLVGMVGNLAPSKGHLGFIEAAALIKRQSARPVKFVIVGRDLELWRAYSDQLRATVTTLGLEGDVRFEGYRADIADVLSAFDVLVVPSHWEPLGVIVMEGMAAGKPIVATDAGGIPEMVHDGVEALLFPPQDAQKLADAVLRLTTNAVLAANLAANARRRVWDAFSPQQAATAYAWLYDSMAQPDRSTGIAAPREFVAAGLAGEKPEAQS